MADRLPMPPRESEVSPNGQEIWDWADRFSREVHRRHKMRELQARIRDIGTKCGDCGFWMKKGQCPKELGTMKGGPTSGDMRCRTFTEARSATSLRATLQSELAALSDGAGQSAGGGR